MDNGFIVTTCWESRGIIYSSNITDKEMENKGLTPEAQYSEKVFNDVINGVVTFINNRVYTEREIIRDQFKKDFKLREDVIKAKELKEEYYALEATMKNLFWDSSKRKVQRQLVEMSREAAIILQVEIRGDNHNVSEYLSIKEMELSGELVFPKTVDTAIVKAKFRLVSDYLNKSFKELVKIAE